MSIELKDPSLIKTQSYINGEWVDSGGSLEVRNPANGEIVATVGTVGAAETEQAIAAADAAMQDWQRRSAKERSDVLKAWYNLIMANQQDLAVLMTAEQGKVLAESSGEIARRGPPSSLLYWRSQLNSGLNRKKGSAR